MSLRLRVGDFVAIPLGSQQVARVRLVDRAGRVAVLACRRDDGQVVTLRVLDAAMHERRWEMLGGHSQPAWADLPSPTNRVFDAGRTERALVAFLRAETFEEPYRLAVRYCGAHLDDTCQSPQPIIYVVAHAMRMSQAQLDWLAANADRLHLDARSPYVQELLSATKARAISIRGLRDDFDLDAYAWPDSLQHLALSNLTLRSLPRLGSCIGLRSLDLQKVRVKESLLAFAQIPIVRIRGIMGIGNVADLLSPALQHLAVESQLALSDLDALEEAELSGLTLRDLPQLGRRAFSWLARAERIASLTFDIGARRIQSEVALPRALPHAMPLEVLREKSLRTAGQVASPS